MRWHVQIPKGWQRWFAWYPVLIGDEWCWLEFVMRRRINDVDYYRGADTPPPAAKESE